MDPQELVPLEAGEPRPPRPSVAPRNCYLAPRSCYRVPLKLCRLLAMLIILPCLFIFIPLYLRYRVFSGQMYPMSMTDMRLIDSKISTTWCQRQVVRSNATFNAFVVPGPPEMSDELVPVSMTRQLELGDDMKEYWGFYLLKGSSVTVSTCVRHPGASLIMIKGYKHLQDCAYIGDDSSEEIDELWEAYSLGLMTNSTLFEKIQNLRKDDGKANDPGAMRRHKAGVSFHDPKKATNTSSLDEKVNTVADTDADHDPKELRAILERLHALREAAKNQHFKNYHLPSNIIAVPALHRHRDTNVNIDQRKWLSFQDIDGNKSEIKDAVKFIKDVTTTIRTTVIQKEEDERKTKDFKEEFKHSTDKAKEPKSTEAEKVNETKSIEDEKPTESLNGGVKEEIELEEVTTKYTTKSPVENTEEPNSKEVFEDVLLRLQALGDRGKRVLMKLHQTMGVEYHEKVPPATAKSEIMSAVKGSDEELDRLRKVLVEAIDEEKSRAERRKKRQEAMEQARAKRETMLAHIELQKSFNEDDEARDYAAEEGLEPDGVAEHHMQINETTPLDMSNSEFWSSFSSSEEALLECEGLILNLPLTPHSSCVKNASENLSFAAAQSNALTYRVPANGYYFFVFSSENEVNTNFIRARFELQKTRYDIARSTLRRCTNSTQRCDLPLDIFSSQKVVLELPLRNNDSLWNEQFVIISECEPRTSIYMVCVIAVPILIVVFAFQ
ncbi:unnamed protein product [Arctia plantaginis]|uniref:E3 ubiquitin-protein ligase APD1-4 middle domain-containing protein n=1 Tax=Arctia plantaginis TaxID=874455 RepID=A0A8S0Z198_ARCPL|nr:unnamed protein product [Arctia plantaginis]